VRRISFKLGELTT